MFIKTSLCKLAQILILVASIGFFTTNANASPKRREVLPVYSQAVKDQAVCSAFLKRLRAQVSWSGASGIVAFPSREAAMSALKVLQSYSGPPPSDVKRWSVLAGPDAGPAIILKTFQAAKTNCMEDEVFEDIAVLIRDSVRLEFPEVDRRAVVAMAWKTINAHVKGPARYPNVRRVVSLLFRMSDQGLLTLAPEALPRMKEIDAELQKAVTAKGNASVPDTLESLRKEASTSAMFLKRLAVLIGAGN